MNLLCFLLGIVVGSVCSWWVYRRRLERSDAAWRDLFGQQTRRHADQITGWMKGQTK